MGKEIYSTLKRYYEGNYSQLCNYVSKYIGNDMLSRDLVHDSFLVVMDRYLNPPDEKRYSKIIRKVLQNSIYTYFRETKNTIPMDETFFNNIKISANEEDLGHKESVEKLIEFFGQLDNPGKIIIYLNLYEGYSLAQVARMTGYKQRNIYFWKNKALKELQKRMEKAGYEDE